ncbi:C-terminal binding protein [Coraliomargarita sp. SDUM461003]|uniref:C-terminal binding protein n=1 Tax=Thalassobacterium maritimum TaxID=3041265 RepID=A0ABU1AXI4_9BACT|nr:C-terminal binding protein [Coraliomargarita sp. SDUM461003]MDQ8208873.1 C-terminal binding protein [Coraliomargarita sp. SDUM461003]
MKHKVVIAEHVDGNIEIEREVLGADVEIVLCKAKPAEAFMEAIKDCDALMTTNAKPMNRSELAGMPKCRVVARYGIGYDSIDVEAATDLGIMVTNNPSYCVDEVAEHALALILSAWRRVTQHAIAVKAGEWAPLGGGKIRRLKGRTLGILGFGAIGQGLAKRASGLGMDIVFHDPFVDESVLARSVSMDELLEVADVLSLHMPLIDSTRGIVDKTFLGKMKQDAILVNCSRGPLIKTDDLLEALNTGEIGMAALDTTDPEPIPKDHPLLACQNALVTPHSAWFSEESTIDLRRIAALNVAAALRGEVPTNLVNKDVKLSYVSQ